MSEYEKLVPEKTALVIIDLQKGITSMETKPTPTSKVIRNASILAKSFRDRKMKVFPVHVNPMPEIALKPKSDTPMSRNGPVPDDWADFVPELNISKDDIIIEKKQWGAFYGTELDLQLRRRKIDTIVLCGIATTYGVESTARFAYEYGYNQIFASDAMGDMSEESHNVSIKYVLKRIGRVLTTDEILKLL